MPSGFVYFFSCSSVLLSRNNSVFCPELGLELRGAQVKAGRGRWQITEKMAKEGSWKRAKKLFGVWGNFRGGAHRWRTNIAKWGRLVHKRSSIAIYLTANVLRLLGCIHKRRRRFVVLFGEWNKLMAWRYDEMKAKLIKMWALRENKKKIKKRTVKERK